MTGDREVHLAESERRDIWALPEIESLKIERVGYRGHAGTSSRARSSSAARASRSPSGPTGEIPIRALSPALHVGETEVAENEQLARDVLPLLRARRSGAARTVPPSTSGGSVIRRVRRARSSATNDPAIASHARGEPGHQAPPR